MAPSSYYYRPPAGDDLPLLARIEEVLADYPTYGYRRVTVELARRGAAVNHKGVLRVMQANDLIQHLRRSVRTTNSQHGFGRFPNLLQGCPVLRPDQVWCADITYIRLPHEFVYLAIVLDIFTRSLRAWYLGQRLNTDLALRPLEQALQAHRPEIHHSDQGIQYAAPGYVARLQAAGVRVSMAEVGQPRQNPFAERVIRTIKDEAVYLNDYRTLAEARANLRNFIEEVYQTKRIHSALGYLTPAEFEAQWQQQHCQNELSPRDRQ